jgi:hypothetical protein
MPEYRAYAVGDDGRPHGSETRNVTATVPAGRGRRPLTAPRLDERDLCPAQASIDTRLPPTGHDLCTFQMQLPTRANSDTGSPMPTTAIVRASTILSEFERARAELVGKAVILTDGMAGTVESIWLDEMHGLRISIRGHHGKWPISTIKFGQQG